MAAINAPTNKASDRQSAISPVTNIGGWFRNSANIGCSPQTRWLCGQKRGRRRLCSATWALATSHWLQAAREEDVIGQIVATIAHCARYESLTPFKLITGELLIGSLAAAVSS